MYNPTIEEIDSHKKNLVERLGSKRYLEIIKSQIEMMPWTSNQKFEEYYQVRESLKALAV